MVLDSISVGPLQAYCYILTKGHEVLVIDPGGEFNKISPYLESKEIVGVLITHDHEDHIGALEYFDKNLIYAYHNLKAGYKTLGPFTFEVIETPGHSIDSLTYYFEEDEMMFTGDFLFKGTIGRTDFKGGSDKAMHHSLKKISKYPNADIYPGHGLKTTLDKERANNVYFSRL